MMKNILLIALLCSSFNKSQAQDLEFTFFTLHILVLKPSIDDAQKILKDRGFVFNGATESRDSSGGKELTYTRCSFMKKSNIYNKIADEIVLWRQKDSTSNMFEMLEYNTYNESTYNKFKSYCETNDNIKKLNERIDKNCIYIDYSEKGFLETFQNCTDNNIMVYKVTILNLIASRPE